MASSRGGMVSRILREGTRLASVQRQAILRHLDEMATADPQATEAGGGTLTRQQHLALLGNDEEYQLSQLASIPWMTVQERRQMQRDLVRAVQQYHPQAEAPQQPIPPSPFTNGALPGTGGGPGSPAPGTLPSTGGGP